MLQNHKSHWLPHVLRDWTFLPFWMRSLKPLDDIFVDLPCCAKCTDNAGEEDNQDQFMEEMENGRRYEHSKAGNHAAATEHRYIEEMQVLVQQMPKSHQDFKKFTISNNSSRQEA